MIKYLEESYNFGVAIQWIKQDPNNVATRMGWNGKDMWIAVQFVDSFSKMRRPYIYMKPVDDQLVPWLASQSDMLEEDWKIGKLE